MPGSSCRSPGRPSATPAARRVSTLDPGPGPQPTTFTLNVTNGWDSKNLKTLAQEGKVASVTRSDDTRLEIESGQFLALQFASLANTGSIQNARLSIEHHEEGGFNSRGVVLQAGGGALTAPFVARDLIPFTASSDRVLDWDVTAWARDASRVNDLKLAVRNDDPTGKKIRIDQVTLTVTLGPAPAPSSTPVEVRLYATDGWDQKNSKTLQSGATLYRAQVGDNQRHEVERGYFLSYAFQGIPSSAGSVTQARVFVEHHEEQGVTTAPPPVTWEVSTGDARSPGLALTRLNPPVLSGEGGETTVAWDVSAAVNRVALVNDVKLVVRNQAANGKKTMNDRAYLVVRYVDAP